MRAGNRRIVIFMAWLAVALALLYFVLSVYAFWQGETAPAVAQGPAAFRADPIPGRPAMPGWDRYAGLAGGELFFGPAAVSATAQAGQQPEAYVSSLVLRGIVMGSGGGAKAVLARAGAAPEGESWIVSPGESVLGEKVLAIGEESVTLGRDGARAVLTLQEQP